jgi:hypothetical protein
VNDTQEPAKKSRMPAHTRTKHEHLQVQTNWCTKHFNDKVTAEKKRVSKAIFPVIHMQVQGVRSVVVKVMGG